MTLRSSCVSRLSMLAPVPCTSSPIEWPVRWTKYSPNPRSLIGSGRVIDFEAVKKFAARDGGLNTLDGAVPGITDHFENVLKSGRRSGAAMSGPSDVVEHGGRLI